MDIQLKRALAVRRLKRLFLALFILLPPILLQSRFMLMFVPSESMYPCLGVGDFLIGTRNPKSFTRGDILVFRADNGQILIKRLIGLPGEQVCLSETGAVYIDGKRLEEPYVFSLSVEAKRTFFNVPDEQLLFLGDNRSASLDARYWDDPYIDVRKVMAIANYKILPTLKKLEESKNEHRDLSI